MWPAYWEHDTKAREGRVETLAIHSTCMPRGQGWVEHSGSARGCSGIQLCSWGFPDDVEGAHRPQQSLTASWGTMMQLRAEQTCQLPGEAQSCRRSARVGDEFRQRGEARCHVQGAPATSLSCVCTVAESLQSLRGFCCWRAYLSFFSSKIQAALRSLETSAQPSGQLLKGWQHRARRGVDSRVWVGSFSCWETLKLAGSHGAMGVTPGSPCPDLGPAIQPLAP